MGGSIICEAGGDKADSNENIRDIPMPKSKDPRLPLLIKSFGAAGADNYSYIREG